MDIVLALGGGGMKGLAHLGVIDYLEQSGFNIRAVAGTSIGGVVGAVYASGLAPRQILNLVENMNPSKLYTRRPEDGPSLLGYGGLAELLVSVLNDKQFSDLCIPFACTAVDIRTSREVYLSQGRVVDAALATMAIPGVFPPKFRGEMELIDGAILDPVPVNLARLLAPELPVVAVVLNPERAAWERLPFFSMPSIQLPIPTPLIEGFARLRIGQAFQIFGQSMDISMRMLTELRLEVDKPDVIIRPNVHQYGILDTVVPKAVYDAGLMAGREVTPAVRKSLSWPNNFLRRFRRPPTAQSSPDLVIEKLEPPAIKAQANGLASREK